MNKIFYFCDRKKCERCYKECLHTSDPAHALDKEGWPYIKDAWGNYEQYVLPSFRYEDIKPLDAENEVEG